ncbi:MAG: helix-turn-helix transcriptional regulator, partial [Saprospiraceae bacterium]|nr:helix-turn-helix transcriptional regulator [Saprospiraceae bacterium]
CSFGRPQASFNFCLKGKQLFALRGNYLPAQTDNSQYNTLLLPNTTLTAQTEAWGEFSTATLHIDLQGFLALLGESFELLPENFQKAAQRRNLCYFKNSAWHPGVRQIVACLQTEQFDWAVSEKLFLESKMLEILAIVLELNRRQTATTQYVSKRDAEKIRQAREILEGNLANPPGLAQLARAVGSNEFTLKKGFKQLFGMPVFQFLKRCRMNKAHELVLAGEHRVEEIAAVVGYENISAFSRAFRQTYGCTPSDLRKTPFRHI